MKKIVLGIIVIVFSLTLLACNNQDDNGMIPDPGGKFLYDRVIVMLTHEAFLMGKIWQPSDFTEFEFSDVVNIAGSRMLIFHLAKPSRDNVLTAIYRLRKRLEIFSAEVDNFDWPMPSPH